MPVCRCNNYCPNKKHYRRLGAVCASDGNTYKDFCHMLHHSCRLDRELWVIYYGDCKKDSTYNLNLLLPQLIAQHCLKSAIKITDNSNKLKLKMELPQKICQNKTNQIPKHTKTNIKSALR